MSLYLATYKTAGLYAQLQKEVYPTEVEQEVDDQARVWLSNGKLRIRDWQIYCPQKIQLPGKTQNKHVCTGKYSACSRQCSVDKSQARTREVE